MHALKPLLPKNELLRGLSLRDWHALSPHLEVVDLRNAQILCGPERHRKRVYFPISATVSFVQNMEDGRSIEVAAIGREGTTGMGLLGGVKEQSWGLEVQCAGTAYCIAATVLEEHLEHSQSLRRMMMLHLQVLFFKVAQLAACHRHHSVEQQLCRWILDAADATLDETLRITQQRIADLLCVRRESITQVIGRLHKSGVVARTKGGLTIASRHGIEARSCECYAMNRNEANRLLALG